MLVNANQHRVNAAGSNNATVIKASGGFLYGLVAVNTSAALKYVKFYDKATTPAPATDTALLRLVLPLAANAVGPAILDFTDVPIQFANGISYAMVTGAADNDNTAVTANDVVMTALTA